MNRIYYHGTDRTAAKQIQKKGFRAKSHFASALQDALEYGGPCVFEVILPDRGPEHWQIVEPRKVASDSIVSLTQYTKSVQFNNDKKEESCSRPHLPRTKHFKLNAALRNRKNHFTTGGDHETNTY